MIVIIGNARSGTSWLGKIFDSHPDVVYRHEPDSTLPCRKFPFFIENDSDIANVSDAEEYLKKLCHLRTIRSVGRRPHFDKSYRSSLGKTMHVGLVSFLQLIAKIPIIGQKARRIGIPDFFSNEDNIRYAIKSVVSLGRAGLYSRALQDGKLVFIIRHPCGVVASQVRGMKLGKLTYGAPFQTISNSKIGRNYDLTVERLKNMPQVEALAWTWVVMNEQALLGVKDKENAIVVTHESLCANAAQEAARLFDFCGLSWSSQTEQFLNVEPATTRTPSFYELNRESSAEIDKWRKELDAKTIDVIESILSQSPLNQFYSKH